MGYQSGYSARSASLGDFKSPLSPPLTPLLPLTSPGTPTLPKLTPRRASLHFPVPNSFRNRLPTQLRRRLPLALVFFGLVVLIFTTDGLRVSRIPLSHGSHVLKRQSQSQYPMAGFPDNEQQQLFVAGFPRKIWQTWKTDPLNFDVRDLDTARSWTTHNPAYRYEVLTDDNDMAFVEKAFGPDGFDRPDIVDTYRNINATIIKADLLRYMVMYAEGGVYADIDVESLKPVTRFVPERYDPDDIDLIIGVEIDQPEFRDHPILGKKSMSFCQWTFMARPRLPVMLRLIENIMRWISAIAKEQNVPISEVVLDFDEVISGTGPSAFTAAVLAEMNAGRPSVTAAGENKREITWENSFHAMSESKLVSRVLVLDVEAFAAGQGHSDSGTHSARGALVKHHYHASNWPSRHPRFRHLVFGEVERCNWDRECVRRWDADVAGFDALPEPEKQAKLDAAKAEQVRQLAEAQRLQDEAVKLEKFVAAVRKAEDDARRAALAFPMGPPPEQAFGQQGGGGLPAPPPAPLPQFPPQPLPHFPPSAAQEGQQQQQQQQKEQGAFPAAGGLDLPNPGAIPPAPALPAPPFGGL